MHILVAGTLHRAVVGSTRIRLLSLQDHKTKACNVTAMIVFLLAIAPAEQMSWHIPAESRQDSL